MNYQETRNKNLVNDFITAFRTSKYLYRTNQSISNLKDKINFVIEQKEFFDFKYNLTGKLNSDNTFKLKRRMGLMEINEGIGTPLTIQGTLIEIEEFKTDILINIKLNWTLIILPIVFTLFSTFFLVNSIITNNAENIYGVVFLIVLPIFWATNKSLKRYYKLEFENALHISNSIEIE